MIEYPAIINSNKAPREECVAFDKLDGSNLRFKYTQKRGFELAGTRTQLIDENTPVFGEGITIFNKLYKTPLTEFFKSSKEYRDYREIIVFGEFLGPNSFAGIHIDEPHELIIFDVLVGHKNRKFIKPKEFVKTFSNIVKIPKVIYEGNLNDQFIQEVRNNKFNLSEGVICKGNLTNGAFRGNIWMCKIKTLEYLNKLKTRFGEDGVIKYGE